MMGAVLFGYLIRLGLIFLAVFAGAATPALGFAACRSASTIIVTHLGLLFWELRYVSASLAFPGLKPAPTTRPTKDGR